MMRKQPPLCYFGLATYAVLSMGSMATMSLGTAILVASLIPTLASPSQFQELWKLKHVRIQLFLSLVVSTISCLSLVSTWLSPLSFHGQSTTVHFFHDIAKLWYFFLPFLLAQAWTQLDCLLQARVVRIWLTAFGLISSVGLIQFFTGWPRAQPNPLLPGYFHTTLGLGHHLSVANAWIFPYFAALDYVSRRALPEQIGLSRKAIVAILLASSFSLFFTYSRTLWIALPIGLLVFLFQRFSRKTALVMAATLVIGTTSLYETPWIQARLRNSMGIQDRVELWKANLEFWKLRPWTGVGLGKNQELSHYYFQEKYPELKDYFIGHAHNLYLELIAGIGLVGLATWIAWLAFHIRNLLKIRNSEGKEDPLHAHPLGYPTGLISAWVAFLINGLTQVNFWESKVLHHIMWAVGFSLVWIRRGPVSQQAPPFSPSS